MDHRGFDIQPIKTDTNILSDNQYYPEECTIKPLCPGELDHDHLSLKFALGWFASALRPSYCFVSESTIAYPSGNVLVLLNTNTLEQQLVHGPRSGGIISVAIHPNKKYIAVAEHGEKPYIYIYSYPEIRLYRVLRGGGELVINQLAFSHDEQGKFLASVAGDPDYALTIWDWRNEHVTLRSKAFSQDVFQITFSPTNPLALITSGMGHIKFWNMASTFTGLKLQGILGKFGATELCDIPCFAFLPNGKVLAGTDVGMLLVWDGNTIEAQVSCPSGKRCHIGSIEYIAVADGEIVTAGEDGYIRTWDVDSLETHNTSDGNKSATAVNVLELDPLDEYYLGKDIKIASVRQVPIPELSPSAKAAAGEPQEQKPFKYIVKDTSGILWRIDKKTRSSAEKIWSYPSGVINAIDTCSSTLHHLVAMAGADGTVSITDPLTRIILGSKKNPFACTSIRYLPQTLDNLGCSLMAGFADGSIRFFQHTLPTSTSSLVTMSRTHAFKPHSKPICSLILSSDSSVLATATVLGEVFFFTVSNTSVSFDKTTCITPVGFINLGFEIRSLTWASEYTFKSITDRIRGRYILISEKGEILLLTVNLNKQYEQSHNFLIPATDYQTIPWNLESYQECVSSNDLDTKTNSNEQNVSKEKPTETDDEINLHESSEDSCADKHSIPIMFQVTQSMYVEQDHIIVAIESNNGVTEIRSCLLTDGKISRLLLKLKDFVSISCLTFSASGRIVLIGCTDGTIYYRPVSFDTDLNLEDTGRHDLHVPSGEYYWRVHIHANKTVGIQATFDDAIYISVSSDRSIFVLKSTTDDLVQRAFSPDGIAVSVLEEAEDLTNNYTIQEAKMKMQIDQENSKANERKAARNSKVVDLRHRLNALIGENKELPSSVRLSDEAFYVDPGLEEFIAQETCSKIEEVKKKMTIETQQIESLLDRLSNRFHDLAGSHQVKVHAFQNDSILCSFKPETSEIRDFGAQPHTIGQIGKQATNENVSNVTNTQSRGNDPDPDTLVVQTQVSHERKEDQGVNEMRQGIKKIKKHAQLDHNARMEQRRLMKIERQEQWKQLLCRKPSTIKGDPREIDAIKYAENHMGDYKLKSDKNYIVPENERVNADMKHRQLSLLQISLDRIIKSFNEKVEALVQTRKVLERDIEKRNGQIDEAQETLDKFRSNKLNNTTKVDIGDTETLESFEYRSVICQLEHFISRLQRINKEITREFDSAHEQLCQERLSIATDLQSGEIRLALLYQEWKLLKDFEKHDNELSDKLSSKKSEKDDIDQKINDIQSIISIKRKDIENTMEARKALDVQLTVTIGENSKFEDLLRKIFHRKVKRRSRTNNQARNTKLSNGDLMHPKEESSSSEELESETDISDHDHSVEEDFSEECPVGCDPKIHEEVLSIREHRLDLEQSLFDVQKSIDGLRKDFDLLSKKEKAISAALQLTEQEIQIFQSQKQQKLNELDVVVPLASDQIECSEFNKENSLVFSGSGIKILQQRIIEIEHETEQVRKDHKELKREHVDLLSARKQKRVKLKDLEKACVEVQMLKFGRTVDLDRLEKMGVNKLAEDLRQQISEKERQYKKQLEEWDKKIISLKSEITEATIANTKHLKNLYDLTERRKTLEHNLNKNQTAFASQFNSPSQREIEEHNHLLSTVNQQAHQIESLKHELAQFLRKPSELEVPYGPRKKKGKHNAVSKADATKSESLRSIQISAASNT